MKNVEAGKIGSYLFQICRGALIASGAGQCCAQLSDGRNIKDNQTAENKSVKDCAAFRRHGEADQAEKIVLCIPILSCQDSDDVHRMF